MFLFTGLDCITGGAGAGWVAPASPTPDHSHTLASRPHRAQADGCFVAGQCSRPKTRPCRSHNNSCSNLLAQCPAPRGPVAPSVKRISYDTLWILENFKVSHTIRRYPIRTCEVRARGTQRATNGDFYTRPLPPGCAAWQADSDGEAIRSADCKLPPSLRIEENLEKWMISR